MAKYAFNYDSGEYEYIERDGFSIDRGEYVYNWDDSEYRREEEEEEERRRESSRIWDEDCIFDPDYDHDDTWMNSFWRDFVNEISEPVSEDKEDHSYEYVATQLVAEYYRTKGLDGICFKSSVGIGKNYVFFMGPDPQYTPNAYPYPFDSEYYFDNLPILREFTEAFTIDKLSLVDSDLNVKETKKV